jgi:hypothetical protein
MIVRRDNLVAIDRASFIGGPPQGDWICLEPFTPSGEGVARFFTEAHQEDKSALAARRRGPFDHATPFPDKIVLFGAGQFGRLALTRLRERTTRAPLLRAQ